MNTYSVYKTTSCDWIDQIPSRWEMQRIKRLFTLRDERSYKPLSEVNLISLYASVGVKQHKDIVHTTGNKARNAEGYKIVYPNDIVVNILLCWMGAIGLSKYHGVTSPAYDIYRPITSLNTQYFNYLFRTSIFSQQCYRSGKGIMAMRWRTYSPQFYNIMVPVPPRDEQDQIVRFLDWKVSKINKLIAIKRQQIARLEELKQISINDSVLGKLGNYTHLKDSGIDFIGQIPAHWDIIKLKRILSIPLQYGANATDIEFDNTLPRYIRITDITSDNKLKEIGKQSLSRKDALQYILDDNDILFARSGATVGKSFIFKKEYGESAFAGYLIRAKVNLELAIPEFVYAVTLSKFYELWKDRIFIQSTIQNISAERYNNLPIPLPPLEEQKNIIQSVIIKIKQIEKGINRAKFYISELTSLKSRLIADTVTGKIDVRGIEIPEYEVVEELADSNADENGTDQAGMEREDC